MGHIPVNLVRMILVRNTVAKQRVEAMVGNALPNCQIVVDTNNKFYYRQYD